MDREQQIFLEARQLDPLHLDAFLQSACGEDAELLQRVRGLLAADQAAGGFLGGSHSQDTLDKPDSGGGESAATEHSGQHIGRYKLLQKIGEGGFGEVWMAEQKEPVKRRVALKIIKLGMDTKQVIARFEAERQALAMMEHPHIARVLDAGSTTTGRPYFVMELVKGLPIGAFCAREKLDTRQRLELFMQVCLAVQHAHHKGIIHRDIKPSNVLVMSMDGIPVPKIIDFGIAKATNMELTERTLFTEHRQLIGTPAYMSPEQADFVGFDVDTRTDIYALGALLYELLTGVELFDRERFRSAGLAEMRRIICEEDALRPSVRFAGLEKERPNSVQSSTSQPAEASMAWTVAGLQRTDVRSLTRSLRGDLDWITMKCLEKDRSRRYDTASGLAQDIRRHLDDEPVLAGRPSALYRLKKYARRHTAVLASTGTLAATVVIGFSFSTVGYVRASTERDRARQAQEVAMQMHVEAEAVRQAEADMRQQAQDDAARARAALGFLTDVLQSVDPRFSGSATLTTAHILQTASAALDSGQLNDQPLVEAELRMSIAEVFEALMRPPLAIPQFKQAAELRQQHLGPAHVDSGRALAGYARARFKRTLYHSASAKIDQAMLEAAKRAVGILTDTLGEDDVATLRARFYAVLIGRAMTNAVDTRFDYQRLYQQYGDPQALARRVMELRRQQQGPTHPDTWWATVFATGTLGHSLWASPDGMDPEQAVFLLQRMRREMLETYGPDHALVVSTEYFLLWNQQEADVKEIQSLADRLQEALGPQDTRTQRTKMWLAGLLAATDPQSALRLMREATTAPEDLRETTVDELHNAPHAGWRQSASLAGIARRVQRSGQTAEALALYKQIIAEQSEIFGLQHAATAYAHKLYADGLSSQQRHAEAGSAYETALEIYETNGITDRSFNHTRQAYARSLQRQQRHEQALAVLDGLIDGTPQTDTALKSYLYDQARSLRELQRLAPALRAIQRSVALSHVGGTLAANAVPNHLSLYALILLDLQRPAEARPQLDKALQLAQASPDQGLVAPTYRAACAFFERSGDAAAQAKYCKPRP